MESTIQASEHSKRVPWTLSDVVRTRRVLGAPTVALPDLIDRRYITGALVILFQLTLLLPVWWWSVRKYRVGWDSLGFRGFAVLPGCGMIISLLLLGYVFTGAWGLVLRQYGLRAQPNPLPLFGDGVSGLLIALLAAGIVAPLTEEIFFRGFVFGALRERFGFPIGIVVSSLVFGAAHLQLLAFPALFALGALLGLLYHWTGSIWPSIILHSTINTVALLVLYFVGDLPT